MLKNTRRLAAASAVAIALTIGLAACEDALGDLGGLTASGDLTGSWEGKGTFQASGFNSPCQWNGKLVPPSVFLTITQDGEAITGGRFTLDIPVSDTEDLAPEDLASCPPFDGTLDIVSGTVSSSGVSILDEGGNTWSLTFTSDILGGTVDNPDPAVGIQGWGISLGRQ